MTGRRAPWRLPVELALVGAVAVACWSLVQHLHHQPSHDWFDLGVYRGAVRWWLDGRPLYSFVRPHSVYGFTYPPFAAVVMVPLAGLGLPAAIVLTTTVCVALVAAATWWLVAPIARRIGWSPWFATGLALPVVLIMDPVRETLGLGQVNVFVAALVVADVAALRRGWRWAGVGIGLAAAVKLTPAIFVLYLLLTRRRRAAGVAVCTTAAASLAAAAVSPRTSAQFWLHTLWDTSRVGDPAKASNQSLDGVLARLTEPGAPDRVVWAVLVLAVLVVGLTRAARAARQGDEWVGVTLTGVVGCLVSPISWSHHLVWLVPAVAVLVDVATGARLAGAPVSPARRRAVGALAGASAAVLTAALCTGLFWYASPPRGEPHPHDPVGLLTENSYVLALLVVLVLLPARSPGGTGPAVPGAPAVTGARGAARSRVPPRPGGSSPR